MKRELLKTAAIGLVLALATLCSTEARAGFVYVNGNTRPNRVFGFSVTPSGNLVPVPGSPFLTGGNGGFCFDIGSVDVQVVNNYLYATNTDGGVSGFSMDPDSGVLTLIPGSPFSVPGSIPTGVTGSLTQVATIGGPGFDLLFDATRRTLTTNTFQGGQIGVYDVDSMAA